MSEQFKSEVLTAFQKVSPSKVNIEDPIQLESYVRSHRNLFQYKLHFPPAMFQGKGILDFGCGTGEVDVVLARWGATVEGFDFNPISVERANWLRSYFALGDNLRIGLGDVDTYEFANAEYDVVASFGVIAHVPDQRNMFGRMANACRSDGYVILGYIEEAGLIQRLLHRAIVMANAGKSDAEIFKVAEHCFKEHIDRSVKYGGRSAASVINDYLVNPHYHGLSVRTLLEWGAQHGLVHYSSWPNIELPMVVDSPYFPLLDKCSPAYGTFLSLNRLRWIFAQQEDRSVLAELDSAFGGIGEAIERFIQNLSAVLQEFDYSETRLAKVREDVIKIDSEFSQALAAASDYAKQNLQLLNGELLRILEMTVRKARDNIDIDLAKVEGHLFRGYNGLGTSYVVFHKPNQTL